MGPSSTLSRKDAGGPLRMFVDAVGLMPGLKSRPISRAATGAEAQRFEAGCRVVSGGGLCRPQTRGTFYVPPFDDEAVEGWGTRAVSGARFAWCSLWSQQKIMPTVWRAARSDYTPRSGRRPRRAPVRQDVSFPCIRWAMKRWMRVAHYGAGGITHESQSNDARWDGTEDVNRRKDLDSGRGKQAGGSGTRVCAGGRSDFHGERGGSEQGRVQNRM